jgi:hypothetical protein
VTEKPTTQEDYRAGSAHVMVLAVLLVIPVLKLTWTLGGGNAAADTLSAIGPANWLDIVVDIFLGQPLLATVLAIAASRITYAFFAAKGGALRHQEMPLLATAATAAIVPVALGLTVGAFNGLGWGLAAALGGYLLRLGVIADYNTGRRTAQTGKRTGQRAGTALQWAADVGWITGLVLAVIVLPLLAIVAALNGRAWTSVLTCDVNTGSGIHRARVLELDRWRSGRLGHTGWRGGQRRQLRHRRQQHHPRSLVANLSASACRDDLVGVAG